MCVLSVQPSSKKDQVVFTGGPEGSFQWRSMVSIPELHKSQAQGLVLVVFPHFELSPFLFT